MIIDDFVRDEQNEVWAICGDQKIHLDAAYIAANKPQVGDEIAQAEPEAVEPEVVEQIVEVIAEPVIEAEPVVETIEPAVEEVVIEQPQE